MIGLRTGADAGCSHSFPTGSAVRLYPLAGESGFLTPSVTSTGPQSLSMFVEDCSSSPSSGAAEVVQNLFRVQTASLKMDLYEQSTTERGETTKTVLEDET